MKYDPKLSPRPHETVMHRPNEPQISISPDSR